MPGFNVLAVPRYSQVNRRVFGEEIELSSSSPELAHDIIHELDPQQWWFHKRHFAFTTQWVNVLAAVGILGALIVTNPANSGIIAIIDFAGVVTALSAGGYFCSLDPAAPDGASAPCVGFDTRLGIVAGQFQLPLLNATKRNGVAVSGAEIDRFTGATGADRSAPLLAVHNVILTPGHSFGIFDLTANETARMCVAGHIVPARPEELLP